MGDGGAGFSCSANCALDLGLGGSSLDGLSCRPLGDVSRQRHAEDQQRLLPVSIDCQDVALIEPPNGRGPLHDGERGAEAYTACTPTVHRRTPPYTAPSVATVHRLVIGGCTPRVTPRWGSRGGVRHQVRGSRPDSGRHWLRGDKLTPSWLYDFHSGAPSLITIR